MQTSSQYEVQQTRNFSNRKIKMYIYYFKKKIFSSNELMRHVLHLKQNSGFGFCLLFSRSCGRMTWFCVYIRVLLSTSRILCHSEFELDLAASKNPYAINSLLCTKSVNWGEMLIFLLFRFQINCGKRNLRRLAVFH